MATGMRSPQNVEVSFCWKGPGDPRDYEGAVRDRENRRRFGGRPKNIRQKMRLGKTVTSKVGRRKGHGKDRKLLGRAELKGFGRGFGWGGNSRLKGTLDPNQLSPNDIYCFDFFSSNLFYLRINRVYIVLRSPVVRPALIPLRY